MRVILLNSFFDLIGGIIYILYFAGFWFVHCHFDWHLAVGMALVLQVGELNDMKTAPKGFPKCNNFQPKIYQ